MAAILSSYFFILLVFPCVRVIFAEEHDSSILYKEISSLSKKNVPRTNSVNEINVSVQRSILREILLKLSAITRDGESTPKKTYRNNEAMSKRKVSKRSAPLEIKAIGSRANPVVITDNPNTIANVNLASGGNMLVEIVIDLTRNQYMSFGWDATDGELKVSFSKSDNSTTDGGLPSFSIKAVNINNTFFGPITVTGAPDLSAVHFFLHINAIGAGSNVARLGAALGQQEIYKNEAVDDGEKKISFFGISFSVGGFLGTAAGGLGAVSLVFVFCCCCCCCNKNPFRCCCPAQAVEPTPPPPSLIKTETGTWSGTAINTQISSNPPSADDNSRLSKGALNLDVDNYDERFDPPSKNKGTQETATF